MFADDSGRGTAARSVGAGGGANDFSSGALAGGTLNNFGPFSSGIVSTVGGSIRGDSCAGGSAFTAADLGSISTGTCNASASRGETRGASKRGVVSGGLSDGDRGSVRSPLGTGTCSTGGSRAGAGTAFSPEMALGKGGSTAGNSASLPVTAVRSHSVPVARFN